jgi:hypothetical protein
MSLRPNKIHVFLAVLFLGLFALATRNVNDPDLGWHLKTGQLIVQQGKVPHTDPFSYTSAAKPWIAHEWLADVLLYEVHSATGWAGLIVLFAALLCIAFYWLYLRCGANAYVAGVATLWAAVATRPTWGVRPQVLSFLLTSLWLLILERSESNPKLLWWTLPITLLWVNLHAGFAAGLALVALFLAGEWIEQKIGKPPNPPRLRLLAVIFPLDLLIVPINPNGTKLFWYPIATLHSPAMQSFIAEWASPNFHRAEYWPFLLILLCLLAMFSWSRTVIRSGDLLLVVVTLFAALRSIRLIPLFVLIAVPLISKPISAWISARPATQSRRVHLTLSTRTILDGALIVGMATFVVVHAARVIRNQPATDARLFPEHAVAFLQDHSPQGGIFNHYDWGGYLIWKLYPTIRVFIDGRADIYGDDFLHEFAETYQFKDDWRQNLERWNIQTVVVPVDSALATGLLSAPDWRVSYQDAQAIILTRSSGTENHSAGNPSPRRSPPNAPRLLSVCKKLHPQWHLQGMIGVNISPASDVRVTGTQIPAGQSSLSARKKLFSRLISF